MLPRAGAFQDRDIARALMHAVDGGGTAVLTGARAASTSVLTGLGGVGKTQLAANHAHTLWDTQAVDLVVWIPASTSDDIVTAYAGAAVALLDADPTDPEQAARRLLEWLAATGIRWLIVFDDVQDPADLNGRWPPHSTTGQVVVTTRRRDAALYRDQCQILDVGLFTTAESLAYLTEKLPTRAQLERGELAGLAADLGYLPLALAQAAAYLFNKPLLSCAGYRALLADRHKQLRDALPRKQELPDEHHDTVAATWSLSIDAASKLEPAGLARLVLEMTSLLDPAGIPTAVFTTDATTHYLTTRLNHYLITRLNHFFITRLHHDITADDAIAGLEHLQRFSLLTLDPTEPHRAIRVHGLVQRATRDSLTNAKNLGAMTRATADALTAIWPEMENDPTSFKPCAPTPARCTRLPTSTCGNPTCTHCCSALYKVSARPASLIPPLHTHSG
jgi:hypothetical protein